MILRDYQCPKCDTAKEYLEERESPMRRVCGTDDCEGLARRVMSASSVKTSPPTFKTKSLFSSINSGN